MSIPPLSPSNASQENSLFRSSGWLGRLNVVQKIGLGYALVVGIVVAGTATGIKIAQRYEQEAYEGNEDAVEEILSLSNLEKSINRFIAYERQLITWFEDPERFFISYDLYRASGRDFQEDWAELIRQYDEDIEASLRSQNRTEKSRANT